MSRKMWRVLWPEIEEDKVPITYVTNGVHIPTWVAPEMAQLYTRHLGRTGSPGMTTPVSGKRWGTSRIRSCGRCVRR